VGRDRKTYDGMYSANNEGRKDERLCRNEMGGREQSRLESCNKPILGSITGDDDDMLN
jgi:hypothetical protein